MPNIYDRIIKENIESLIPALTARTAGLVIEKMRDIKDKVQVTLEGEADFLKLVLHDNASDDFILQLEFQTSNSPQMLSRMLQYRALLYARHQLPVKQLVYYLGNGSCNMKDELLQERLAFSYQIINIADFEYESFVQSGKPEEIILAILCNFRDRRPAEVIRRILQKLNEVVGIAGIGKYIRQLEVLSNLRNLQEQIKREVDNMPFNIDLSKDRLFVKGIELGEEKGRREGKEEEKELAILNLLVKLGLSAEQTAAVLDAPLELVKQIERSIKQK